METTSSVDDRSLFSQRDVTIDRSKLQVGTTTWPLEKLGKLEKQQPPFELPPRQFLIGGGIALLIALFAGGFFGFVLFVAGVGANVWWFLTQRPYSLVINTAAGALIAGKWTGKGASEFVDEVVKKVEDTKRRIEIRRRMLSEKHPFARFGPAIEARFERLQSRDSFEHSNEFTEFAEATIDAISEDSSLSSEMVDLGLGYVVEVVTTATEKLSAKTAPPPADVVVSVPESALPLQKAIAPTSTRLDTITTRLTDLRLLVGDHPEDADARQRLAKLLFTGMNYAKEEERLDLRDAMLAELRKVSQASPEDAVARDQLARGLGKTAEDVRTEDRPDRSDALLSELRVQSSSHPEEPVLRNWLGYCLCGAIAFAKEQGRLDMRNALLDELRQLFRTHPQEPALAANYAKALVNDLLDADTEDRLHILPSTLEELRQIFHDFPQDDDVRKQLGLGLMFAIDNSVSNQDALLQEQRLLAGAHPQQVDLRETLAFGLATAIRRAAHEKQAESCESVLDELRQLVNLHPQDAVPRGRFASSLKEMMIFYLESQGDSDAFEGILGEFRQLARRFPEDEDVRVSLGESLLIYIQWSRIHENEKFGDLMVEVRELSQMKPENKVVWDMFHKYWCSIVDRMK